MKTKPFAVSREDKRLVVTCDDYRFSLGISIDFDDVPHDLVKKDAKRLVDLLNKHWSLTQ